VEKNNRPELPQRLAAMACFVVRVLPALTSIVLLGGLTTAAFPADHPPATANCHSCHADKTRGLSVHSAMEAPCTTCHLALTENAKTIFVLAMPKEQICFACHEKTTIVQQHIPQLDKSQSCVGCHDSHSSEHRMLLSAKADAEYQSTQAKSNRHMKSSTTRPQSSHNSVSVAKSGGSH
jgi:predicted CXXCH cytochrome family protein